ncbi:MAG: glycosyltransferase [Infirmifilum sp.]
MPAHHTTKPVGQSFRTHINEAMDRARAFLHATINEHWGIAVAEAMARGLTPVVHKSGGAWTDLVKLGKYGMGISQPRGTRGVRRATSTEI